MSSPMRTLGSGAVSLQVSSQGFGCMGMTSVYNKPIEDADGIALFTHAFANGVTHWDTAEAYQAKDGEGNAIFNETLVGKGIAAVGKRDQLQIATKYMPKMHQPADAMTPEMVVEACRASCVRLGVEFVDIYYVHRLHDTVPVEEQAKAMNAVRDAGLAKCIGVSEFSPANLRKFHAICPVTCVQQEWSLMNRDLEEDLLPVCRELGIGIVAYSPLCRKLLSGEISSSADLGEHNMSASRYGKFKPENIEANAALAARVGKMAAERRLTAAQLSLSWVASQGEDVCPIPGTTKIAHLNDNIAASRAAPLSAEERAAVAACIPIEEVRGDRFTGGAALTYKANM